MTKKTRKILLLPGDGIGPEVVAEVKKIINWFNKNRSLDFKMEEDLVGGASIDVNKVPITDEVFYKSLESDAVILGACGGPKWESFIKIKKGIKTFC
jgi:3-isopropylmalate dehydrogenase